MKTIVITGGTRGIGYGLADAFLALDCNVAISGRNAKSLEMSIEKLADKYSPQKIRGYVADVRHFEQVQALWDKAKADFGKIDIWINNAAMTHPRFPLWEQTPETLAAVVETNLIGTMYGAKVAITGMLAQGFGAFYNLEGSGSSGTKVENLTLYGTTKYGIRFLTESLVQEMQGTPIVVGAISPGIVVTDLITGQYNEQQVELWERSKRVLNILADRVETVTPWLAEQILANQKTGIRIAWLTKAKAIRRFWELLFLNGIYLKKFNVF
ncbi:MAG: SDR family oxidoreductase [Hydrococcus sp. RU_2_2]|nr:SDR family oxidoreductase [Hydrococcus sp. RU_2_2]